MPNLFSIFFKVGGVTLFQTIYLRPGVPQYLIRHEKIHAAQQKETKLFYFIYLWDYIKGLRKYRTVEGAYRSIRFEIEAYENMYNSHYLDYREPFAWKKLIKS